MIKILFVCHGNICRSPMAEFVMKDLVAKAGLQDDFLINSAATSREEIGCDVHYGTKEKLREKGIPFTKRKARQMTKDDYKMYDYIIVMDDINLRNLRYIVNDDSEHKVYKLLSFAGENRNVKDPWYTGNFDETYNDVNNGCTGLLKYLIRKFSLQTH